MIYWGPPNTEDYISRNCFISRENFDSDQQLYEFMKNMSKEKYDQYIINIRKYLKSDKAQLYSIENFINIFLRAIEHGE